MAVFATVGSALGFAALEAMDLYVMAPQGLGSCLCPPLGATAVLLFAMTQAPASSPKNVIGGYLVSSLVALAVVNFLPPNLWYLSKTLAVAGACGAMALTGTLHPPGGAYAFLFVAQKLPAKALLAPGLAGAVILVAVQQVLLAFFTIFTPAPAAVGKGKKGK